MGGGLAGSGTAGPVRTHRQPGGRARHPGQTDTTSRPARRWASGFDMGVRGSQQLLGWRYVEGFTAQDRGTGAP